jgi:arylsulfatase A-like enzyme
MVESLDANVGRILTRLQERGLEETTAVFFMSDNGGVQDVARNAPFRGGKGTLWEGGIRTPLFARWKGEIPPGTYSRQLVAGMDLFPTVLEIAGLSPPRKQSLDGVSLLRNARGWNRLTHDTLCFHYFPPGVDRPWKSIVRDGWKYLADPKGGEYLFHLREDIGEQNNLVDQDPQRAVRMRLDLDSWRTAVFRGAPKEPRVQP